MTQPGVTVSMFVQVSPADAFEVFTEEIHLWWKRSPMSRFRQDRAGIMRFEPGPKGRLIEHYDETPDDPYEVGRILHWEPGRRLVFEWRLRNFAPHEVSQVEVRFEAAVGGTRVTLEHRGLDALPKGHPARHGLQDRAYWEMMAGWWQEMLRGMKAHAASRAAGS